MQVHFFHLPLMVASHVLKQQKFLFNVLGLSLYQSSAIITVIHLDIVNILNGVSQCILAVFSHDQICHTTYDFAVSCLQSVQWTVTIQPWIFTWGISSQDPCMADKLPIKGKHGNFIVDHVLFMSCPDILFCATSCNFRFSLLLFSSKDEGVFTTCWRAILSRLQCRQTEESSNTDQHVFHIPHKWH